MAGISKCKQCRREGTKLFLKGEKCFGPKCPIVRRNYPPGVHGPSAAMRKKKTAFGYAAQLREKQKAKRIYRLHERQFRNYVVLAQKKRGDSGAMLRTFLEMRLDNALYRAGFAKSRDQARQMVTHGLLTVNGRSVTIPSYQVGVGDLVAFKDRVHNSKLAEKLKAHLEKCTPPSWLAPESDILRLKVIGTPKKEDFELVFDTKPIIEYYSR